MMALLSSTSILYIKKLRLSNLSKDAQQVKPGRWSNSRGQVLKQPAKPPHLQSPQGKGKAKKWSRSHQPIEVVTINLTPQYKFHVELHLEKRKLHCYF